MSAARTDKRRTPFWLGIDFSGNHMQWRQSNAASAIWIARVQAAGSGLALHDLRRAQDLPGDETPFARLVRFLRESEFAMAGIDAPTAPPSGYFPGSRADMLKAVRALPCADGRPFPTGAQLLALLAPSLGPRGRHIHRATEQLWRRRGINVRSVLWNGPRGGAPFAAACFTLLAATGLDVFPWADPGADSVIAETFPAAQLKTWGLPWYGYNGVTPAARHRRRIIVDGIAARARLAVPAPFKRAMLSSADALDSVVCALAARALSTGALADPPSEAAATEGWIVVHR